jgi:glycosyltransferase involved in cell wall biosynthesis
LLVDDGSTDGSLDVARRLRDPRVRVVSDGERLRLPRRLNQIADAARGPLVARLDADDMMHPARLARQVRALADQPAVDFVGTAFFALGAAGDIIGVGASAPPQTGRVHVLRKGLLAHATLLFRRSWLAANRYDERYPRGEDRELYCRTLGAARFAQIGDPLYFVRHTKDPATMLRDYVASSRDHRRIVRRLAPRVAVAPLLLESLAKEEIFRVFTRAGLQHVLVRRRGRPPTDDERREGAAALARIRATRVDGLEGPS